MSMTKQQALEIIEKVSQIYNMDFNESKLETWIDVLSENGDYEPTVKEVKNYITSGNSYPPNLPRIMRKYPKKLKYEEPTDKDKEHRWRMENDPEYVEKRKKLLKEFKKSLREFEVQNNERT